MSKVFADKIEPRDSSMDVTIGTSTNTVTLAGNDLRANTVKDSGGNTLWTSDGSGNLSSVNSALAGNLVLLSTQTASAASSVSFTSDIDDTYDVYIFTAIDTNPVTNGAHFQFQGTTDGSNYNIPITSSYFHAEHNESDGTANGPDGANEFDQAQGTDFQHLNVHIGNGADESGAGILHLFSPASSTYVKHFQWEGQHYHSSDYSINARVSGYLNTASPVTGIQFKFSSGNFDGIIKMYGLL